MPDKDMAAIRQQFETLRPKYERMAKQVAALLAELLQEQDIGYFEIRSRAKDVDRFCEKAARDEYADPLDDIHDMAGVRVIVCTLSDRQPVSRVIKDNLRPVRKEGVDKDRELGTERAGYRGWHYICRPSAARPEEPEWRDLADLVCEVQVRTLLAHAWAEVNHGIYKLGMGLPMDLARRFALVAATLELADLQLDELAREAGEFETQAQQRRASGDLDVPVTPEALQQYVRDQFPQWVKAGLRPTYGTRAPYAQTALRWLEDLGITTVAKLHSSVPPDIDAEFAKCRGGDLWTFLQFALLRIDAERFMEAAWPEFFGAAGWLRLSSVEAEALRTHGAKLDDLISQGRIIIRDI